MQKDRVGEPVNPHAKMRQIRNLTVLQHGCTSDPELTDAAALASVRSGSPSIEVLVFTEKGDDICFLPWQYGGKRVSADNIPSEEETKEILKQRLRLSSIFSK